MPTKYKIIPKPSDFTGANLNLHASSMADAAYNRNLSPARSGPTQEDLILAINKMMGTAPARAQKGHAGIPFLLPPQGSITAVNPSEAALRQAYDLIQGAKLPADMDQASQTEMLLRHLRSQGIHP